jgi:hypothetical protein
MRHALVFTLVSLMAGFLSCVVTPAYAQSTADVGEQEFVVFMLCNDDVEGYCEKDQVKQEKFLFREDSKFVIGTFEDQLVLSGNYSVQGLLLEAEFSALEDVLKTYDFTITGLLIGNFIMVGLCDVEYTFIGLNKEEARCYFLGFSMDEALVPDTQ